LSRLMTLNPDKENEEKVMRNHPSIRWAVALVAFCLALIPSSSTAQQETKVQKPVTAYRLEFSVREFDSGKRVNSRNYMMMATENEYARIRVGDRVPYQTTETQFQYQDVGMNIDCRPREHESGVALEISVEFSSVAPKSEGASSFHPVIRSDRTTVQTVVAFDKPTLVASLDDVESNRRYEVEVTATKVK